MHNAQPAKKALGGGLPDLEMEGFARPNQAPKWKTSPDWLEPNALLLAVTVPIYRFAKS